MKDIDLALSEWVFPRFVFFGILIFAAFRLLRFLFEYNLRLVRHKKIAERYLPLVEFLIWLIFMFGVISFSLEKNILLAIAALVLVLYVSYWISQYVFKGFIAGVVFRFTGRLRTNENIKIKGHTGKIVKLGGHMLEMETEKGEILFIPYTEIADTIQAKTDNSETIRNHNFLIQVKKTKDIEQLKQDIRACILQLPWASVKRPPQVAPIDEESDMHLLKVTVYSIEREYFHRIEKYVKEKFEGE